MNIEKLKDVVQEIQFLKHCGASDSTMIRALVEYLYDESNGKLLEYFTMIDDIRKTKVQEGTPAILVTFSCIVASAIFSIFSSHSSIKAISKPGVRKNSAQKGKFCISTADKSP